MNMLANLQAPPVKISLYKSRFRTPTLQSHIVIVNKINLLAHKRPAQTEAQLPRC